MKNVIIGILSLILITEVSFADNSCRYILKEKLDYMNLVGKVSTGASTVHGASIILGASSAAGPVVVPIAIGVTLISGSYWFISTRKTRRLIKLIDQAKLCYGNLITKSYKAYEKSHPENYRMTKEEFCSAIVMSDLDGSICVDQKILSIRDVGRHFIN